MAIPFPTTPDIINNDLNFGNTNMFSCGGQTKCAGAPPPGAPGAPPGPVAPPGAVPAPPGAMGLIPPNQPPHQPVQPPELPMFNCPRRPNLGREGRPIVLRANHFQISMPRGFVHHYEIQIQPDKCPRKVNREIIETMSTRTARYSARSSLCLTDETICTREIRCRLETIEWNSR
uniref:Protein argonaute-1 n=1 Tax=Cacopsylla melanoneura TaxID=428564 RepID=A0A8D8XNS7_9HEMI